MLGDRLPVNTTHPEVEYRTEEAWTWPNPMFLCFQVFLLHQSPLGPPLGSLACREPARENMKVGPTNVKWNPWEDRREDHPAQQVGESLLNTSRERSRDAPLSSLPATYLPSGPISPGRGSCLCLYWKGRLTYLSGSHSVEGAPHNMRRVHTKRKFTWTAIG
jgi:hypothetical protein